MANMSHVAVSKPAVLLLGNYRPTVVVARRLRARGFTVIAGLGGCEPVVELSRYVDRLWDHPQLADSPQAFLTALDRLLIEQPEIACVFPVAEDFVRLFAEYQPKLPAGVHLASVAASTVRACLDKRSMMDLAQRCAVPVAPFAHVRTLDDLFTQATQIGFPLVIRPERSTDRLAGLKALSVDSMEGLAKTFSEWPMAEGGPQPGLLIQRKADGLRHNLYFAARSGVLDRVLHATILRTDRLDGSGLAVDGEVIAADPALVHHVSRLVAELGYDGVGCAQFLVDEKTGAVCFLEINARIAGNHAVPDRCGMALETFLLNLDAHGAVPAHPIDKGQVGLRYGWLAGDIEGLKLSLRAGELTAGQAVGWLARLARTSFRANMDMALNWHDPLPGLATLLDTVPGLGHLTRSRRLWRALVRKPFVGHPHTVDQSNLNPSTHRA